MHVRKGAYVRVLTNMETSGVFDGFVQRPYVIMIIRGAYVTVSRPAGCAAFVYQPTLDQRINLANDGVVAHAKHTCHGRYARPAFAFLSGAGDEIAVHMKFIRVKRKRKYLIWQHEKVSAFYLCQVSSSPFSLS